MGGTIVNIGIFLEIENNKVLPVGLELIGKTMEMMGNRSFDIHGIAVISNYDNQSTTDINFEEVRKYINQLFIYEYEAQYLTTDHYKEAVCKYVEYENPSILLLGATPLGRSFGPRVAAYFKTGITADCTEIKYDEKYGLIQIRPAFGEEVLAEIVTPNTFPQMATVRPGVMDPPDEIGKLNVRIVIKKMELSKNNLTIIKRYEREDEEVRLDKAKIAIIAGNAIKEQEDLRLVERVAKALGGEFGVTRPLVEGGLAPYSRQVGVSGVSLLASIVLLLGVSGSNQTLAGIRKAKKIVAINNDPDATIFNKVDIGIIDDWKDVALSILDRKVGF